MSSNNPLALIVEDDLDLSLIFQTALERAGYTVSVRHRGEEGLEWLTQTIPKLIVLDLNLPDIQGDKVLGKIRSEFRFDDTRIILATANHLLAQSICNQADLVLVKSVSYSQLRDLTGRFL